MLNTISHLILDLTIIATEVHVYDTISNCLFLLFTLALFLYYVFLFQFLIDRQLIFVLVEATLVLLERILEVVILTFSLLIDVGKVILNNGLQFLLDFVCFEHTVEHLKVWNHSLKALVSPLQHSPLLQSFYLVHTSVHQVVKQLLKLIFRTVVNQLLLEDFLQFLLIRIFNELIQFLPIHVHDNLLQISIVDSILKGEDEVDGLVEVALQQYLLEELYLLTVEGKTDLDRGWITPVSRYRVRKDSMQSLSLRYFLVMVEVLELA